MDISYGDDILSVFSRVSRVTDSYIHYESGWRNFWKIKGMGQWLKNFQALLRQATWRLRERSRQAGSKGNIRGGEAAKPKVEYFYLEISVQGKENEAWHLSSEISAFERQVYFCINTGNLKAKHCSK